MNYWMTTHWPPRIGEGSSNIGLGVWVALHRKEAGKDFGAGDKVIIYGQHSVAENQLERFPLPDILYGH